ncbi:MAG: hypothetical protein QME57_02725 [Patescibacteria group bacterium]|nr:hypothetical protein [Patescibacteria group bacterium]
MAFISSKNLFLFLWVRKRFDSLLDVSAGEEIEEKIKTIAKAQNIEISSLKTQKKFNRYRQFGNKTSEQFKSKGDN